MNGGGTRLVFPGLAGFYASMQPIAYTLMRVVIGVTIFIHGWGKVMGGAGGVAGYFAKLGMPAPGAMAYWAIFY